MRALVIIGLAVLCLLPITSARPRGGDRDGKKTGGKGALGLRQGRAPLPQACQLKDGEILKESMECRREGACNGDSLTVAINQQVREVIFCNHTKNDEATEEEMEEGVIAERLRLSEKTSEEELMLKYVLRSACKVNDEVKKTCEDCSLGPLEVTVNGTSYTALYCNKESSNETEWLKVFKAACRRNGGKDSSEERDGKDSSEEHDGKDSLADEDDDLPQAKPFRLSRYGRRGRRSPRASPGSCMIQAMDNTTLDTRPCPKDRQCNVGPVEGVDADDEAIKVFFCERKESSEESEEEEEDKSGILYKKLLCNACQVKINNTDVVRNESCQDDTQECNRETFSFTDKSGSMTEATYCSPKAPEASDFFLIDAFRCNRRRKPESSESSEESSEEGSAAPRPQGRVSKNGARGRGKGRN